METSDSALFVLNEVKVSSGGWYPSGYNDSYIIYTTFERLRYSPFTLNENTDDIFIENIKMSSNLNLKNTPASTDVKLNVVRCTFLVRGTAP
jgi:hypothetical protein